MGNLDVESLLGGSRGTHTWLVTGAAGFIGSNLVEALLRLDQRVIGIDNFATGHARNLQQVRKLVTDEQSNRFVFHEMDIRDFAAIAPLFHSVDYVLHQAALGSVPGSMADPLDANDTNVSGFLNVLTAARDAQVQRFVYASSSAVYGDEPTVPKLESMLDEGLSPYAVNKQINELYARVYSRCYGIQCVGLRYFNVFGPRQDPNGAYAAVIPRWISALIKNEQVVIFGDGGQTRDFCHIDNVVQANLRAALVRDESALNTQYNIANGECTDLNALFATLCEELGLFFPAVKGREVVHGDVRTGDIRHSVADITLARNALGYEPTVSVREGLRRAMQWYIEDLAAASLPRKGVTV